MNSIRAINVALVSEDLTRFSKLANSIVAQTFDKTFRFDTLTPHVTLLQIYAYKDDVTAICSHVENIVAEFSAPKLVVEEVEEGSDFNSHKLPGFKFANNEVFETLHKRLFHDIAKYSVPFDKLPSVNLKSTFCNANGEINQDSVDYVKNFLVKNSNANYSPHSSVGCVPPVNAKDVKLKIEQELSQKEFEGSESVVVAHLANYCTVSSIFSSYKFSKPGSQTK